MASRLDKVRDEPKHAEADAPDDKSDHESKKCKPPPSNGGAGRCRDPDRDRDDCEQDRARPRDEELSQQLKIRVPAAHRGLPLASCSIPPRGPPLVPDE